MLKYQLKYHTNIYRPLSEWPVPIIDRDTDPCRFRLSTRYTDMQTLAKQRVFPLGQRMR